MVYLGLYKILDSWENIQPASEVLITSVETSERIHWHSPREGAKTSVQHRDSVSLPYSSCVTAHSCPQAWMPSLLYMENRFILTCSISGLDKGSQRKSSSCSSLSDSKLAGLCGLSGWGYLHPSTVKSSIYYVAEMRCVELLSFPCVSTLVILSCHRSPELNARLSACSVKG